MLLLVITAIVTALAYKVYELNQRCIEMHSWIILKQKEEQDKKEKKRLRKEEKERDKECKEKFIFLVDEVLRNGNIYTDKVKNLVKDNCYNFYLMSEVIEINEGSKTPFIDKMYFRKKCVDWLEINHPNVFDQ